MNPEKRLRSRAKGRVVFRRRVHSLSKGRSDVHSSNRRPMETVAGSSVPPPAQPVAPEFSAPRGRLVVITRAQVDSVCRGLDHVARCSGCRLAVCESTRRVLQVVEGHHHSDRRNEASCGACKLWKFVQARRCATRPTVCLAENHGNGDDGHDHHDGGAGGPDGASHAHASLEDLGPKALM